MRSASRLHPAIIHSRAHDIIREPKLGSYGAKPIFALSEILCLVEPRTLVESMASDTVARAAIFPRSPAAAIRVLAVIPGEGEGANFIFARRQVESLLAMGLSVQTFYLKSRSSPVIVLKEWLRLRRSIVEFSPDIVHAHYGTVTSF